MTLAQVEEQWKNADITPPDETLSFSEMKNWLSVLYAETFETEEEVKKIQGIFASLAVATKTNWATFMANMMASEIDLNDPEIKAMFDAMISEEFDILILMMII